MIRRDGLKGKRSERLRWMKERTEEVRIRNEIVKRIQSATSLSSFNTILCIDRQSSNLTHSLATF
jgi:hypothetical protein